MSTISLIQISKLLFRSSTAGSILRRSHVCLHFKEIENFITFDEIDEFDELDEFDEIDEIDEFEEFDEIDKFNRDYTKRSFEEI